MPAGFLAEGRDVRGLPSNQDGGPTMHDLQQAIRERAYQLWIESGHEHGNADAHWLAAQRDILSPSVGAAPTEAKAVKPKKVKASRKRRAA